MSTESQKIDVPSGTEGVHVQPVKIAPDQPKLTFTTADKIKEDENNANIHTKANLEMIEDSVEDVDFWRSISIDENDKTWAGNGTLAIAKKRGAKVIIVEAGPNELVAVRRTGLSERDKTRYALRDNKATRIAKENKQQLARLAELTPEQPILAGIFRGKDLDRILAHKSYAQPLASGGIEDEPTVGLEAQSPMMPASIRTVPLYLDGEQHIAFITRVRALARHVGGTTITETVVAAINHLYSLLPEPSAEEEDVVETGPKTKAEEHGTFTLDIRAGEPGTAQEATVENSGAAET